MHKAAIASALILVSSVARAQDNGCKPLPTFTPARNDVSELRCFPLRSAPHPINGDHEATSPLVIVLAGVGTAGLGAFIGFGIGGQSQLVNGIAPRAAESSVRIDYAIANVGLAVGLTALVTSIVLVLTHH